MKQVLDCAGFDSFCCYCCGRDNATDKTLVDKLAKDPDTGKETCNYWINFNTE